MTEKETVLVLFGGKSTEYKISCISAGAVIRNLNQEKYDILPLGITEEGEWLLCEATADEIAADNWKQHTRPAILSPDAVTKGLLILENPIERRNIDVVFPVLHGKYGEDGCVQGLLELSGIPYVGMGVFQSSAMMDKHFAKMIFHYLGIPQADWVFCDMKQSPDLHKITQEVEERIGFPCFVKPCNLGSSIGVNKAENKDELIAALEYGAQFDHRIIIEEFMDGYEVESAVLGNGDARAAEVGQIKPVEGFYDYDAKYVNGTTELLIPADVPEETRQAIREYAVKVFRAIGGTGLSRIDWFVHKKTGKIYLNEINTMPGFTSISMYPKMWEASGMEYSDLLDRLITLAKEG